EEEDYTCAPTPYRRCHKREVGTPIHLYQPRFTNTMLQLGKEMQDANTNHAARTTAGGYDRGEPRAEAEKLPAELVPTEAEPEPAEAPASRASGWAVAGRPGTGTKLFIQH
ncbi:hypothetical protein Bbelb_295890, partial [Branchiostoma belcheri]